jgi:acetyl-CoA C-acetyltransferase
VEALASGALSRSIVPVVDPSGALALAADEGPRAEVTPERLAALKPSFEGLGRAGLDDVARRAYPHVEAVRHIHTAGNSSALADGAAAVLLAAEARGRELGLRPRARLVSAAAVGDEPVLMLNGPIPATRRALARAGMTTRDVDLWEINEAFAVVTMAAVDAFKLDPAKVNVNGGACSIGHPIGGSGARILTTLVHAIQQRNARTGLATLCIGGGEAAALLVEKV